MRTPFPGVVFEVGAASYGVLLLLVGAAFSGGGHDSRVATLLWSPLWLPLGILAPAFWWLAARVANRGWGRAAAALARPTLRRDAVLVRSRSDCTAVGVVERSWDGCGSPASHLRGRSDVHLDGDRTTDNRRSPWP